MSSLAETEHISRAAASLFLTQGAVTQQVRHFEKALGLQLLERDGRRVRLTDAACACAVRELIALPRMIAVQMERRWAIDRASMTQ